MKSVVKVGKVGKDSLIMYLPKELAKHLDVDKGDSIFIDFKNGKAEISKA